ncbi:hypothetical protein FHG87_001953 [Trinorchestia longiramus]|nr:hypothetical protein FHG87_001953 [Trinorchestia longiramus]
MGQKTHYHQLWCQCDGDPAAVPRETRIKTAELRLQEDAWIIGIVYMSCVITIYFTTLLVLLCKAGYGSTGFLSVITCACLDRSEPAVVSRHKRRQPSSEVLQKGEKLACVPSEHESQHRTVATLQVPGQQGTAKSIKEGKVLLELRVSGTTRTQSVRYYSNSECQVLLELRVSGTTRTQSVRYYSNSECQVLLELRVSGTTQIEASPVHSPSTPKKNSSAPEEEHSRSRVKKEGHKQSLRKRASRKLRTLVESRAAIPGRSPSSETPQRSDHNGGHLEGLSGLGSCQHGTTPGPLNLTNIPIILEPEPPSEPSDLQVSHADSTALAAAVAADRAASAYMATYRSGDSMEQLTEGDGLPPIYAELSEPKKESEIDQLTIKNLFDL